MRNSVCQSEARGEMTKAPIALQELRRRIYRKAKSEKAHRFWGIFVHVTRKETLEEAYRIAKRNGGAAGIDGQTFETIETAGLECFLADIKDDLETGRYKPHPNRRVDIPKDQGKVRTLQIPCIRDHNATIRNSNRRLGSVISKDVDGGASITTPRSASPPTDS